MNWKDNGLFVIRVLTGLAMFYHGLEVFKPETMNSYQEWEVIKNLPFPVLLTYTGKVIELITGILIALGLFTRIAALIMAGNMLFICFYIGNGRFWYEDQHAFLFAVLAMVFFFTGFVKYGLDSFLLKNKNIR